MMKKAGVSVTEPGGGEDEDFELTLDPRVQESIGRSLKAHYDDIVNTPIPDKFLVLLAQLEAQERRVAAEDPSRSFVAPASGAMQEKRVLAGDKPHERK